MRRRRSIRRREWVIPIGLLLAGFVSLAAFAMYKVTPEDKLVLVEGVPEDAKMHSFTRRGQTTETLAFAMNGNYVSYSQFAPNFKQVVEAVASGAKLRMWVSPVSEALIPGFDNKTLYRLETQNGTVLNYADAATFYKRRSKAIPVFAGILIGTGALGVLILFVRKSRLTCGPMRPGLSD